MQTIQNPIPCREEFREIRQHPLQPGRIVSFRSLQNRESTMADDNIQYDDALSQFTYDDAYIFDDDRAQQVVDEVLNVCLVYDSDDWFTIFVQLFLAFAALMSLWIKRQNEIPKRKFRTWFLDCSKQGVGAVYAHICNMVRILYRMVVFQSCLLSLAKIHLTVIYL